jgi:hypothetical protein
MESSFFEILRLLARPSVELSKESSEEFGGVTGKCRIFQA